MPLTPLPELSLVAQPSSDADVLVVGLADSSGTAILLGVEDAELLTAAQALGAKSEVGCTVALYWQGRRVVVTGVGDVDVTPECIRRAVGNAMRAVAGLRTDKPLAVGVHLDIVEPEVMRAAAEGVLLGTYVAPKQSAEASDQAVGSIAIVGGADLEAAFTAGRTIGLAVCQARDWVNAPANDLYPDSFAHQIKEQLKLPHVDVEILDEKALAKGGFGGILAVGGGSSRLPRLVKISYAPRGAEAHLAMVGKGITFDAGGLNLKPADGMYTMRCDMGGAAAVASAVKAIAELGLKIKVTAWTSLAENLPSGTAFRPSDVLTMYGGTTVENANSDAEGRLVMADALARAVEDEPDLVLDVATLTGACMVALGAKTAGLMASDDATADRLLDAAEAAGEAFWHLPITDEVRENVKSDVADLRSSGTSRYGGALTAAAFLQSFVGETPWAHLDIAGPAFNEKGAYDYTPKGGTGVAVRTLVTLAQQMQASH